MKKYIAAMTFGLLAPVFGGSVSATPLGSDNELRVGDYLGLLYQEYGAAWNEVLNGDNAVGEAPILQTVDLVLLLEEGDQSFCAPSPIGALESNIDHETEIGPFYCEFGDLIVSPLSFTALVLEDEFSGEAETLALSDQGLAALWTVLGQQYARSVAVLMLGSDAVNNWSNVQQETVSYCMAGFISYMLDFPEELLADSEVWELVDELYGKRDDFLEKEQNFVSIGYDLASSGGTYALCYEGLD